MTKEELKIWEAQVESVQQANNILLEEFRQRLVADKLSPKTITSHTENMRFFVNDFLLYNDIIMPQDGCEHISMFIGDFFLRKALWASPDSVKKYISSFKKFYTFMVETGRTTVSQLEAMKLTIKEEKEEWIEAAGGNDGDYY